MPFEASGPETRVPIVLVPGGLSGWISWKPHAEILSKNFRVVRVQLLNMAAAEKQQPIDRSCLTIASAPGRMRGEVLCYKFGLFVCGGKALSIEGSASKILHAERLLESSLGRVLKRDYDGTKYLRDYRK